MSSQLDILEVPKRKIVRESVGTALLICRFYKDGLELINDFLKGLETLLASSSFIKGGDMEQLTGEAPTHGSANAGSRNFNTKRRGKEAGSLGKG
jgi:hypothetical protein